MIDGRDAILLAKGVATYVPGVTRFLHRKGTGGSTTASYCYGLWLKHLTMLNARCGARIPSCMAEIGPGDSIGVGLAALLSGATRYRALDVVSFANLERNLSVFDELVALFRARSPRPTKGWPAFDEHLDGNLFPVAALPQHALDEALAPDRIKAIRSALSRPGQAADGILITYEVPWTESAVIEEGSVDLILSHSVLEHVVDLDLTYRSMTRWLKPGGWMSHQIDFTSHGIGRYWNGHRAYGELTWRVIVGKRPFLINREPPSTHLRLLRNQPLEIRTLLHLADTGGTPASEVAPRWRSLSSEDLQAKSMFVQARRVDR